MVPRLKLLTFDITNTLLKVKISPAWQYAEVAKLHGLNISSQQIEKVYRKVWREKRQQHPVYGRHQGLTTAEWWSDFVGRVFIQTGYNGDQALLDQIADTLFVQFCEGANWELMPDSHQVLDNLKKKNLRLAVVSNFDERLEVTLRKHSLLDYFDFLVSTVTAGAEKPHPKIFSCALQKAGVEPSLAGHVGDDPANDYWGAKNVGMEAFLIDRTGNLSQKELKDIPQGHVLKDLKGLEQLL